MPGPLPSDRVADPFPAPPIRPDRPPAPGAAPGGKVAAAFWIVARFLLFLPVLAPLAVFLFASFWFVSGILLGVGTISVGWLGVFAAMLAFDCLPDGALKEDPFGLVHRIPPGLTPAGAVKELALSMIFHFYVIYAAIFWVFALVLGGIATRLFVF